MNILGYLDRLDGKLDIAAQRYLDALTGLSGLAPSTITCNAWVGLAWTYAHLGDYPHALEYGAHALRLAREHELHTDRANALDAIAAVYTLSGDPGEGIPRFREAIRASRELHSPIGECQTLNNLAMALMMNGEREEALTCARESLRLARENHYRVAEPNIVDTMAQVLASLGNYSEARHLLELAEKEAAQIPLSTIQIYIWNNLGKIATLQGDLTQAEAYLRQALDLATTIGAQAEQAYCHRRLSEIYAQAQRWQEAYEHQGRFAVVNEIVTGQAATRSINALSVAHKLEAAEREADLIRRRAVDLQNEIEQHKRVQADLELQATLDPLTGLQNRRGFFAAAERLIARATEQRLPFTQMVLDLDHFKHVNDTHGHEIGDQVLLGIAVALRESVRTVDVLARIGGEEFVILLPDTGLEEGRCAAERIRKKVADALLPTSAGMLHMTVSIGVAGVGTEEISPEVLGYLLQRADAALYTAKRNGRNQVAAM